MPSGMWVVAGAVKNAGGGLNVLTGMFRVGLVGTVAFEHGGGRVGSTDN